MSRSSTRPAAMQRLSGGSCGCNLVSCSWFFVYGFLLSGRKKSWDRRSAPSEKLFIMLGTLQVTSLRDPYISVSDCFVFAPSPRFGDSARQAEDFRLLVFIGLTIRLSKTKVEFIFFFNKFSDHYFSFNSHFSNNIPP